MHCLWCDTQIIPEFGWKNIFNPPAPKQFCQSCEKSLESINGSRCARCSRPSAERACHDCRAWGKQVDPLEWNYSIYMYNEQMKEVVSRWKYRGDYVLGNAFRQIFSGQFHAISAELPSDTIAVPIPLSKERLLERGFNQAFKLTEGLPVMCREILSRTHNEKQSKKTRKQRLAGENPFSLKEAVHRSVILVDDIYTTGTTLRQAASILRQNGCPAVYAYTLIRG